MRMIRRLTLGIGAALLVGGWGGIQYVHEQQESYTPVLRQEIWGNQSDVDEPYARSRGLFIGSIAAMAVGAGLIGFAVLRPTNRN